LFCGIQSPRIELGQQLGRPIDCPRLDAERKLFEFVVVSLPSVTRERNCLVCPISALVNALALS
jgi:hypothetical protein